MNKKYLSIGYKLLFGLLGMSALVTEIVILVERGVFNAPNFFSFFTVLSNILAVIVFIGGAIIVAQGKKSGRFDFLRGATTLYMVITGIVFSLMLAGLEGVQLTAVPWDNTVLHYIIPVAVLLDWLLDPPATRIRFKHALVWLGFPLAYFAYSLIRGPIAGWYPYPFLNPANGGYERIAITALIITLGGLVMVYLLTRIAKRSATAKK